MNPPWKERTNRIRVLDSLDGSKSPAAHRHCLFPGGLHDASCEPSQGCESFLADTTLQRCFAHSVRPGSMCYEVCGEAATFGGVALPQASRA